MSDNPNTVLYFKWVSLAPDPRQFKPGGPPIFEPVNVGIEIEVPNEFIAEMLNQSPFLTLEGMRYVIDKFEEALKPNGQLIESTNNEEWDDNEFFLS